MKAADFEQLYDQHAAALYGFLAYRTGDRSLAEDLLSDTFERALRSGSRFDRRRGNSKSWLYAIALNLVRDHARRAVVEERVLAEVSAMADRIDPGALLTAVEERDSLQSALGRISEVEREAVALRFGADLTIPEVAKVLGEPLARVEGRVYRGLRKLRDALGEA